MASPVKSNPSGSDCTIVLYRINRNMSDIERYDTNVLVASKKTAEKTKAFIASYFGVYEECDKNLIWSVLSTSSSSQLFEFIGKEHPEIVFCVDISGNRQAVFNEGPKESCVPGRSEKLSITLTSLMEDENDLLDVHQIMAQRNTDHLLIALYNSKAFKSVRESNTELGLSRKLEKIDGNLVKDGPKIASKL